MTHLCLSKQLPSQADFDSTESLSPREIEVLKWTADGKTADDIAEILNVSRNTINFHIKNAVRKLQAANKTAAVVKAAVSGLLS